MEAGGQVGEGHRWGRRDTGGGGDSTEGKPPEMVKLSKFMSYLKTCMLNLSLVYLIAKGTI